jgi:DNA-binding NarL/FixJ family response regulator
LTIRILVADDQALVRAGFRMILDSEDGLEVVAEANDGAAAVDASHMSQPDVILMDIRMPIMDGLEATRRILSAPSDSPPGPRILMLTTYDLDEYVFEALKAGASGFLLKDVSPEVLVTGIRAVAAGDSLVSPSVTRRLIESFVQNHARSDRPAPQLASLTARETEIFGLLARGLSNTEIAHQLFVSGPTVRTHIARIFLKLGLRDRVQAVVLAYETGIVQPGAASGP